MSIEKFLTGIDKEEVAMESVESVVGRFNIKRFDTLQNIINGMSQKSFIGEISKPQHKTPHIYTESEREKELSDRMDFKIIAKDSGDNYLFYSLQTNKFYDFDHEETFSQNIRQSYSYSSLQKALMKIKS